MSHFIGDPVLRPIGWRNGRRWWRTTQRYGFHSSLYDRTDWVEEGFETDLGSVPSPTHLWIPRDLAPWEWVLHDLNYSLRGDPEMTRLMADRIMLEGLTINGHGPITRGVIYNAVRLGGWRTWRKRA